MPKYVYRKADGEEIVLTMTIAELEARQFEGENKKIFIELDDGSLAKRVFTPVGGHQSSVWPKRSCAAGVAAAQVADAEKYDREHGVPTKYDPKTGDAIYTSMEHQRRHLRHHGLVDRDSYC